MDLPGMKIPIPVFLPGVVSFRSCGFGPADAAIKSSTPGFCGSPVTLLPTMGPMLFLTLQANRSEIMIIFAADESGRNSSPQEKKAEMQS